MSSSTVMGMAQRPIAGAHRCVGVSPQALKAFVAERLVEAMLDVLFAIAVPIRQSILEETSRAVPGIPH